MCSHRATSLQLTVSMVGIELAISRSIALSHGGTLVAERGHPTGVRFSLNLPVRPLED
jgi:signal transduction histidine kinase